LARSKSSRVTFGAASISTTGNRGSIGAGLSGALTAYTLAKAGFDVVVLDKREIAQGSTSASTALVLYEIDTPLIDLIALRGRAAAVRSYQCCFDAIATLAGLVEELGDSCELRQKPSLYLASHPRDVPKLQDEFEARKRAGFDVAYLTRSDLAAISSFSAPAAIRPRSQRSHTRLNNFEFMTHLFLTPFCRRSKDGWSSS
jgi:glycine/D-amino acid oxidase-like deaminating enzyme